MDLLCVMGLFPKEYLEQIERDSISGIQNAANKLQWALVDGFDALDGVEIRICNCLYVGSYPKRYRKMMIPTFEFHHREKANDINVGFLNLPLIKSLSRYYGMRNEINNWSKNGHPDEKVIVAYGMTLPTARALAYVKRKHCKIKCCLFVADLPEYMNAAAMDKAYYRTGKKVQNFLLRHCLEHVDCFVLLTENMKNWFDRDIKYTVVEGIAASQSEEAEKQDCLERKKAIVYAGMIEAKYGVVDMVEAFMRIQDRDWTLEVFGDGTSLEAIKRMARDDDRVHVHGMVPNREVLEWQRKASILINPRRNQVFTKYSFPSKIIEYMSSGTPVMSYMLDGMPEEYRKHLLIIEEEEDGIFKALNYVIHLPAGASAAFGESGRQFVLGNKAAKLQCGRIVDLIQRC
jgi:glycosyltransferase involved in cell wall biosynthesis